jgi:penicillin-binding protein 1A
VHFRRMDDGQGARMAMPIWALFMQKCYADNKTGIKKETFPAPSQPLKVELNCKLEKSTTPINTDADDHNSYEY